MPGKLCGNSMMKDPLSALKYITLSALYNINLLDYFSNMTFYKELI